LGSFWVLDLDSSAFIKGIQERKAARRATVNGRGHRPVSPAWKEAVTGRREVVWGCRFIEWSFDSIGLRRGGVKNLAKNLGRLRGMTGRSLPRAGLAVAAPRFLAWRELVGGLGFCQRRPHHELTIWGSLRVAGLK
jgi:hypothetical protein